MQQIPGAVAAAAPDRLKREVLVLVALVLAVDAAFVGLYYLAGLSGAGAPVKLAFTAGWTIVTLIIVLRGLGRIRAERARRLRAGHPVGGGRSAANGA